MQLAKRWHGRLVPSGNITQRDIAKRFGVATGAVIRVRKAVREGKPLTPTGRLHYVFPTRTGGMQTHGNITCDLRLLQRALGMIGTSGEEREGKPKYTPHRTRHWAASWGIKQGWPAKVLQDYLGHATITETFDTYGHLFVDPEADEERFAKSDAAFRALVGNATKSG